MNMISPSRTLLILEQHSSQLIGYKVQVYRVLGSVLGVGIELGLFMDRNVVPRSTNDDDPGICLGKIMATENLSNSKTESNSSSQCVNHFL